MRKSLLGLTVASLITAVAVPSLSANGAINPSTVLPNHRLTPGAFSSAAAARLCGGTTAIPYTVPNVSAAMSKQIFARYHISYSKHKSFEINRLIPVQLGGTNAITNLWPAPLASAQAKASAQLQLHALVCSGRVALHAAQHNIAVDWVTAVRKTTPVTTQPQPPPTPTPTTSASVQPTPTVSPPTIAPPPSMAPPTTVGPPVLGTLGETGQWVTSDLTLPGRAMHTTVLKDGRLLLMAGSGNNDDDFAAGTFRTWVWDPNTGATTEINTPTDMFCSDHVTLADGRVLIMGGTEGYPGVNGVINFQGSHSSYIFDEDTMSFTRVNDTVDGHWYPTATKLGDGDVWMAGGLGDSRSPNVSVSVIDELFSQAQQKWLSTKDPANPQTVTYWGEYPAMFLMANGDLFYSGAHVFGGQRLGTGASIYDIKGQTIGDVPGLPDADLRDQAGSVLLPPAQNQTVMIAGGGHSEAGSAPTNSVGLINLNDPNPHYVDGPSLPGPGRLYQNLINLFDRTVLATNGATGVVPTIGNTDPAKGGVDVFAASIYNPATNTWTTDTPPDPVGRNYHGSTQLLPDGRVVAMGSNTGNGQFELRVSIYSPPYLFRGARPTVSAPTTMPYGAQVALTVSADTVNASLTTLGSQTHQMDSNARLVDLPITGTGTSRIATVPSNHNLLPPGPYMLTVLNAAGVPSIAETVTVQ